MLIEIKSGICSNTELEDWVFSGGADSLSSCSVLEPSKDGIHSEVSSSQARCMGECVQARSTALRALYELACYSRWEYPSCRRGEALVATATVDLCSRHIPLKVTRLDPQQRRVLTFKYGHSAVMPSAATILDSVKLSRVQRR